MNIFKILSSNDGRIHEPCITSLLAYLLNCHEDHGLSSLLLRSIVKAFQNQNKNEDFFKNIRNGDWTRYDVVAEARMEIDKKAHSRKKSVDFDVVVLFYKEGVKDPTHVLGIENKIKDSSRREGQLKAEWDALQNKYPNSDRFLCFLTPSDTGRDDEDFAKLPTERKIHLFWKGDNSVMSMLTTILQQEQLGMFDPIPDDSRFLIKSLLDFIQADFKGQVKDTIDESTERRNYGKPVWEHFSDVIEEDFPSLGKDIQFDDLLKRGRDRVRSASGYTHYNRGKATLQKLIVNNSSRKKYGVTAENHERYDLLYYPDPNNKDIVRRWSPNVGTKEITIFFAK